MSFPPSPGTENVETLKVLHVHGVNRNSGDTRKGFRKGSGVFLSTPKLENDETVLSAVSFRGSFVETKTCSYDASGLCKDSLDL